MGSDGMGAVCSKYLLLILNLIFFILGIFMLYFGFSSVKTFEDYEDFTVTVDNPKVYVVILIVIGFAVLFLSFFGCIGALKENTCMLMTFCSIISVYILIELICIGFIFGFKTHLENAIRTGINDKIVKYDIKGQSDHNRLLDDLQIELKCCGATNGSDWTIITNSTDYPVSCCKAKDGVCEKRDAFEDGCVNALVRFLSLWVGIVVIATLICQLFAIIFACTLYVSSKRKSAYGAV